MGISYSEYAADSRCKTLPNQSINQLHIRTYQYDNCWSHHLQTFTPHFLNGNVYEYILMVSFDEDVPSVLAFRSKLCHVHYVDISILAKYAVKAH